MFYVQNHPCGMVGAKIARASRARQDICRFLVGKYSLWIVLYEKHLTSYPFQS